MSALFRNTLAQSASLVSAIVFSFLLAPVMIDRLGLAQFGVWAVTGALAQYARLLDLGITNALARFVALHDAEGDRRGIEETIGVGLVAVCGVGVLMLGIAVLAAPLVSEVLGVLDTGEMRIILVCAAAISIGLLIDAVLVALPIGLRQMVPPNIAGTAGNVVNFAFSIAALAVSTELTVYALANVAAGVIAVFFSIAAFVYVGRAPFARRPTGKRIRGILSFGMKSQLVTLADLVNLQTDKLVIAALLGPRTAGAYELANRAVQGVLSLGTLTLSALIPTATADIVQRGRQVIGEYFTRYSVRSLSIALPMFGALCVSGPYVFVLWLGEVPPDTVPIVILLSVTFAVNMTTGVPMTLVVSDGHPGVVAQTAVLLVILNIGATIVAAPLFGLWGVLLATVGAQLAVSTIFLIRFSRRYSFPARVFSKALTAPIAVTLLVAVPFVLWYLLAGTVPSERGPALIATLATGGLYGVICWLLGSRLELLPEKLRANWLRDRLTGAVRAPGLESPRMAGSAPHHHILLITNWISWAGAENQLMYLGLGLRAAGHNVALLATGTVLRKAEELEAAGVEVIALGAIGRWAKLRSLPTLVRHARRADLVHCTGWDATLWGRLAAFIARRPAVITEHTPGREFQVSGKGASRVHTIGLHNRVLDHVTYASIVVGAWQRKLLEEEGVRPDSIVRIPNAVPVEDLRRRAGEGPDRASLGIPEDAKVVVEVARLAPQKGQVTVLRAVAALREELGDVRVLFVGEDVGDGSTEREARREAERLGADWAMFLGRRDDVAGLLALSDVSVLPSTGEGLPMSLIESIVLGTPVIATDVGDVGWLIESTGAGVCVAPADEAAFAEACERVLGDAELRAGLAESGVRAAGAFDAPLMVERYESVFDAAISSAPLPHFD